MFDRNGSRKYLNDGERKAYLNAITREPEPPNRAFLLTLFYTGCRISEALHLMAKQIDVNGKAVIFETLKRRKRGHFRLVPIPDELIETLVKLAVGIEPSSKMWVFSRTTAYRMVKTRMSQAGIEGGMACPKGLRHGFAISCVAESIPITIIQKWMGHARLETTAIYLAVSGNEERILASRLWT